MADKCAGCYNKYKYFEKPSVCPKCHKGFCQSCLPYTGPKVKKGLPQTALNPCIYCSKQKSVNESEEKEILCNFQERYYKRTHTEPPIQSKLRLDLVTKPGGGGNTSSQSKLGAVQLSEEDRKLEERLRKLKESHKTDTPSYTDKELRNKLENLRGEESGSEGKSGTSSSTLVGSKGGSVATDETECLMEKSEDEVRMSNQLDEDNNASEVDLMRRQQKLKGKLSGSREGKLQLQVDVEELIEGLDGSFDFEDSPEKLLQDLLALKSRQSKEAATEVASPDIQALIEKAQDLARQEKLKTGGISVSKTGSEEASIAYPKFPGDTSEKSGRNNDSPVRAEVDDVMERGKAEILKEQEEERKLNEFIEKSSDRLAQLRKMNVPPPPDDDVVRSKPRPNVDSDLDFSWGHFGGRGSPRKSGSSPRTTGGDFKDDVQDLIARMLEEAELDKRLEASGLDSHPAPNDGNPQGGASGAAAAPYFKVPPGSDEFPWCCICNDDASMRCYDCDDDLYCQRCFTEGHKQFGLFDHRYEIFETNKMIQH